MSAQKIDPNLNVNQQESVAVTCRELPCFTNCPVLDQATRRKPRHPSQLIHHETSPLHGEDSAVSYQLSSESDASRSS